MTILAPTHYRDINTALPDLMDRVLRHGHKQDSRNGMTSELMMQQIVLADPARYEVYTAGRKASLPAQIAETMWLLAGRNDVGWLSHYLPRAAEFSDDGETWRGGYGPRIRKWQATAQSGRPWSNQEHTDQLAHVVDLLKRDPATRRAVMAIYNPEIDTEPGKDIPCNNWLHFLPRDGVLHLHVATRSNDLMWGWSGINAFEWTVLLNVVAELTEMGRGSVTFAISSLHLYERHWEKAANIAQRSVDPWHSVTPGPQFTLPEGATLIGFDQLVRDWFDVEALIRERSSGSTIRRIEDFPEPMMRSWLWVLYHWHRDDMDRLGDHEGLAGTSLEAAALASPKRTVKKGDRVGTSGATGVPQVAKDFTDFASKLHADKHAAYGDSWKKRGEMLSIMSNVARKIDRLGIPGGGDTSADSAIDLLVYLIKYELWLSQRLHGLHGEDLTEGDAHVTAVAMRLHDFEHYSQKWQQDTDEDLISGLKELFDALYPQVEEKRVDRDKYVRSMLEPAYLLALSLWNQERTAAAHAEFYSVPNPVTLGTLEVLPDAAFGDGTPLDRGGRLNPTGHLEATASGMLFVPFGGGAAEAVPADQAAAAQAVQSFADRNATRRWNPEAGQ